MAPKPTTSPIEEARRKHVAIRTLLRGAWTISGADQTLTRALVAMGMGQPNGEPSIALYTINARAMGNALLWSERLIKAEIQHDVDGNCVGYPPRSKRPHACVIIRVDVNGAKRLEICCWNTGSVTCDEVRWLPDGNKKLRRIPMTMPSIRRAARTRPSRALKKGNP